jgi:hypothetical protein
MKNKPDPGQPSNLSNEIEKGYQNLVRLSLEAILKKNNRKGIYILTNFLGFHLCKNVIITVHASLGI